MNQKTALAIIIALFVIFVWGYWKFDVSKTTSNTAVSTSTAPADEQQVSLQGEYTCLPWKDQSGPHTMECALGIKTSNGIYYAIDAQGDAARNMLLSIQTGINIQLDGTLIPSGDASSIAWQKYDIGGVISTNDIQKL